MFYLCFAKTNSEILSRKIISIHWISAQKYEVIHEVATLDHYYLLIGIAKSTAFIESIYRSNKIEKLNSKVIAEVLVMLAETNKIAEWTQKVAMFIWKDFH